MQEYLIDRILRELSELYKLNRKIGTYKFRDDKKSVTVRTIETECKLPSCSDIIDVLSKGTVTGSAGIDPEDGSARFSLFISIASEGG